MKETRVKTLFVFIAECNIMSTIYTPKKIIYAPNDPFFEEGNIAIRAILLQREARSATEIDMIEQEATDLSK
jgi:predicted alpha/beta-fold hydrolase